MAPQTSTKLTYEDYLLLPDDGRRHEIIDGEHYVSPAPNTRHQRLSKRISRALYPFEDAGLGEVFSAPYDVVLSFFDVVQPDVIFVTAARSHIIVEKNVQGAPDLAVEILSPSNRQYDEQVKLKTYERLGVAEYWIVDPDESSVRIFRRSGERFTPADAGDTLTTPLLPGFALPLRDLFA
ncbi:MAG TPA: Uma2 family endonuclease [Thermoanaerobaculia bacterium]|nr:Uma2 family endonuclease [Thermoanaerobaculia bacterium]